MKSLLLSCLCILLGLTGCGWNGTPTRGPEGIVPLTSIEITPVSSKIAAGTSTKLTARGFYSGVPNDITDQVVWSSSDETVAKFIFTAAPNKNRISGIGVGTAVVTATVGNVSASYTLQVTNATLSSANMVITPANPSVHKGLTTQFKVVGTFSDNTTQDLTFDANWSPVSGTNAKVSNDPASKGLATALVEGSETITASFGTANASTSLVVTAPLLQSITVTPANDTVAGLTITKNYVATGTYSDGTTTPIPNTTPITWASSQPTIAKIDPTSGVATTVASGTTSISATLINADGVSISGKTNLTVTALVLSLTSPSQAVTIGGTITFKLTATPAGGTALDVTSSSTWTSSDTNKATVSSTGVVTGVAIGSTTISAVYNGQTATATVTVQ